MGSVMFDLSRTSDGLNNTSTNLSAPVGQNSAKVTSHNRQYTCQKCTRPEKDRSTWILKNSIFVLDLENNFVSLI